MAIPTPEVDEPLGPFDIYETMDGPRHVVNPVRRMILAKMRGVELTVPEIIAATGLTKSTISTHLTVLYRQRMVAYREDPADRRRKRYYLTARHVASSRRCADRLLVHEPGELAADGARQAVPRILLRAFVAEFRCSGLDVGPIVRETGRRVGEMAAQGAGPADSVQDWAAQAMLFWSDAGLGTLRMVREQPLVFEVDDCGLCCRTDGSGVGLCTMAAGILEGMAAEALRASVHVATNGEHSVVSRDAPGASASSGNGMAGAANRCGCTFSVHVDAGAL